MKKFIAVVLLLLLAFSFTACDDEVVKPAFIDEFMAAADATLSSNVRVETKLVSSLGELNSTVDTVFNPNGSATITYSIENFNEDLTSNDVKVVKSGTVTYRNGEYSDGGEFKGSISSTAVSSVVINLDDTKMEYTVDGGVLTATVKAENVKEILGIDVAADVNFTLTMGAGKIVSLAMNYKLDVGEVFVICTYN